MSNLTSELNLKTAIDDDDTADYLTLDLADSLRTVDGMFNATTGHTHQGSHQGGALQFLDFNVGEDLTVQATSTLKGAVYCQATLSVTGLATLDSLDVTTTSRLRGAVTIDGAINSSGTLTIGQDLSVGRDLTVTRNATITGTLTLSGALTATAGLAITGNASVSGLFTAARGGFGGADYGAGYSLSVSQAMATTFFYQRGSASYRCWDNADFTYGTAPAANTLVQRDASGNISDPRVTGQVTLGGASYTFPTVTGNAGMWRYVKAWGQNLTILLTNGTFILDRTQYTSGQYTLLSGDSVSCYCEGANWWVV